jgi:hypothetical protein
MKNLLIALAMTAASSFFSSPALAPAQVPATTPPAQALKSCFGRLHFVSVNDSLIYCSQAGTVFQDANDVFNRGLLKTRFLSSNF